MNDTDPKNTNTDRGAPHSTCTWCEKVHENPVRVDPFTLGAIARSLGAKAFGASCDLINQRANQL